MAYSRIPDPFVGCRGSLLMRQVHSIYTTYRSLWCPMVEWQAKAMGTENSPSNWLLNDLPLRSFGLSPTITRIKGPFAIAPGGQREVLFRNVFAGAMDFTFTCDNPAFVVVSGDRQNVAAKSAKSVTIKFNPPEVGVLTRPCVCMRGYGSVFAGEQQIGCLMGLYFLLAIQYTVRSSL